jgi:hypothetical protein
MRVATRAVKDIARESGFPEELIERHVDAMVQFTFKIAARERKFNLTKLKAWYFNKNPNKPTLFEVFDGEDYDLL